MARGWAAALTGHQRGKAGGAEAGQGAAAEVLSSPSPASLLCVKVSQSVRVEADFSSAFVWGRRAWKHSDGLEYLLQQIESRLLGHRGS